jgi:hypothetical protein
MNEDLVRTATRFVEVALARRWRSITSLNQLEESDLAAFYWVLKKAGFEIEDENGFVLATISGTTSVEDGSRGYTINDVCPLMVRAKGDVLGKDHLPTGWLNDLIHKVLCSTTEEDRVAMVAQEMKRSIPLHPIQFTREGDYLCEVLRMPRQSGPYPYLVDHTRDTHRLGPVLGIHKTCGGQIKRHRTTEHTAAVFCGMCLLRHTIPVTIATYGELRKEYQRRLRMS